MPKSVRVIHLALKDLKELSEGFLPMVGSIGGYFWPTRQELVPREAVVLELEVISLGKVFALECQNLGSLRKLGLDAEPGYVLSFDPKEELTVQEMRTTVAWNLIGANRRLHPRYPAAFAVAWRDEFSDEVRVAQTENISLGGAFIRSDVPAPVDSLITIHIADEELEYPLSVPGRVAWVRDRGAPGMGVQFIVSERDVVLHLQRLVDRAADRIRS